MRVIHHATHAISMAEIEDMRTAITKLYDLVAQERLKNDANAMDPATKLSVFVDPFIDDDMRDQGIEQSAAIIDGELHLGIKADISEVARSSSPYLLDFELENVLEQTMGTSSMKVNPYQAFDPIPAKVNLILDVDRWTEVETQWSSPITRRFSRRSSPIIVSANNRLFGNQVVRTSSVNSQELLGSSQRSAEFMRQVTQRFEVEGFEPGEEITMLFDGVEVEIDA